MPKLRFNGYYYCFVKRNTSEYYNSVLRFYENNNIVIGVSISPQNNKKNCRFINYFPKENWFNENYEEKGDYIISEEQISFVCSNVSYKGTILNDDKLSLFSHSNLNGYESTEEYKFISFEILNDIKALEDN